MDLSALSTSLPGTTAAESLLDEFKNAALSVTTLYKAANKAASASRAAGYQECLADLLQLLDSETSPDQIRNWALERLCDGNPARRPRTAAPAPTPTVAVPEENLPARTTATEEKEDARTAQSSAYNQPQTLADEMSEDSDAENVPTSIPPSSPLNFAQTSTPPTFSANMPSSSSFQPRSSAFSFRSDMRVPRHPPSIPEQPAFGMNQQSPRNRPQGQMPGPVAGNKRRVPYDFFEMAAASAERTNSGKRGRLG